MLDKFLLLDMKKAMRSQTGTQQSCHLSKAKSSHSTLPVYICTVYTALRIYVGNYYDCMDHVYFYK